MHYAKAQKALQVGYTLGKYVLNQPFLVLPLRTYCNIVEYGSKGKNVFISKGSSPIYRLFRQVRLYACSVERIAPLHAKWRAYYL